MKVTPLIFSYIQMLIVIFILPSYSAEGYSTIKNTVSQLGAQFTPNAYLMNLTFVFLGLSSMLEGQFRLKRFYFHRIVIVVFGLGLIFASLYKHAPINSSLSFNVTENNLHSVFTSITGLSFTVFAFAIGYIEKVFFYRILAFFTGIAATVLSIAIFLFPDYSGIWQRIIFIGSFGWIISLFTRLTKPQTKILGRKP